MSNEYAYDWTDLAFGSKKPLTALSATFIPASRAVSSARFTQLIKELLPSGNIILGIAKEDFVDGFDQQPHFTTLGIQAVADIVDRVNHSASKYKIYTLAHFQRETTYVLEKIGCRQVVLIRGSWQYAFHTTGLYYALQKARIPFTTVSPFSSEEEAKVYAGTMTRRLRKDTDSLAIISKTLSDEEICQQLPLVARQSFDYNFQAGLILAKRQGTKYRILNQTYNKIVPYETYALHHGAAREINYSPPNDLNHYDTVHAEIDIVLQAGRHAQSLKGTTIFINLMPCPACSRMLCNSDISEVVYSLDHSEGYAIKLLGLAGKKVRRLVV